MTDDLFTWAQEQFPAGIPRDVCELFEKLAFEVITTGRTRYSSDAILHRIRWHFQIERGDADFKCNNNWTAGLSRWFMAKHPKHSEFFETRERRKGVTDG